jgi:hypothetical protein
MNDTFSSSLLITPHDTLESELKALNSFKTTLQGLDVMLDAVGMLQ